MPKRTRTRGESNAELSGWPKGAFEAFCKSQERLEAEGHFERVASLERRLRTGDKVREPFERSNADRSADSQTRAEKLQRDAAAKWAERLHANKSATEIAKLIDPEHWNTTRRKIKRP
jgi:hypothetical protein